MTGKLQSMTFGLVFFLFLCGTASGQDISLSSQVSSTKISVNDQLYLTVTVSGAGLRPPEIKLAPLSGFRIHGTPRTSTSTRIENFKPSFSVSYTYVLIPLKTGTFDVGAVTVEHEGKKYSAPPTTVSVQDAPVQQSQAQSSQTNPGSRNIQQNNADIFVTLSSDKTECYVGEQVTVSFEVMNRLTLADIQYSPPSFTGFWSVELPQSPKSIRLSGGRQYEHQSVNTALFPTTAGTYTIEPATLSLTTLGGFFSRGQRRELKTDSLTVVVKPLPSKGKPDDYSGAVGELNLTASVDNTTVKVGDVVTVKISVTGKGNLDLVNSVTEPDLSAFKTYDPRVTDQLSDSGLVVGGAKTWEYVLVPRQQGNVTLGAFTLSYFNPSDGSYHTASTQPFDIIVNAGEAAVFADENTEPGRKAFETVGTDIRYIKPNRTNLENSQHRLHTNPLFYLFYIFPLTLFFATFAWKKRQDSIEKDTGLKRKLTAWKHARNHLKEAEKHKTEGDPATFCGTIHSAITSYIGDIFNVDIGSLTSLDIERLLVKHDIDPEMAQRVRKNLELCDFVRFASNDTGAGIKEKILSETNEMLASLRESVK